MSNKQFEEFMKNAIIEAYVKVMGPEKWAHMTNNQKDEILHIVLNDFAKGVM